MKLSQYSVGWFNGKDFTVRSKATQILQHGFILNYEIYSIDLMGGKISG